ncbi:S8/S53 family peptidase [Branchiibius sp. NY16-3462-2]|uniref:S8 family peptidase n=1 Tax=Branchiibius sp. NY16-3462-2 TaxID=1807500 RepID=UPI0007929321|nr:S8/S53 family peptidase [Branchiibius sp. NY16-3462-2]KYH43255.1 hypothetical protein AZH51_12945 [Branchiibius sp. NY16-3462-2]
MPSREEPFQIVAAPVAPRRASADASASRWHVLDTDATPDAPATAYAPQTLLISHLRGDADNLLERLEEAARVFGWTVTPDEDYQVSAPDSADAVADRQQRLPWASGPLAVTRVTIGTDPGRAVNEPEAWKLLQRVRTISGANSDLPVGLDHALLTTSVTTHGKISKWPVSITPQGKISKWPVTTTGGSGSGPADSYLAAGQGGREPIRFLGPAPDRGPDHGRTTRRPSVGILDSGCGEHAWLTDVRRHVLGASGQPIGETDPATDPEIHPDLHGPLDDTVDVFSGHGTFMAGIVRQTCPSADIVSWRLVGADGTIAESELIRALNQIADLLESGTRALDVLVLALGFYHESPEYAQIGALLFETLLRIRRAGTVVVCSAGNDCTDAPFYPAAFATWNDDHTMGSPVRDAAPLISVGALNPNGTVALFSNSGPWVTCYAPGASVMSTTPATRGGLEPVARAEAYGLIRETIDPDDSTSGFAVWSGTSFAAPYVAGAIADRLQDELPASDRPTQPAGMDAVWHVVSELTGVRR